MIALEEKITILPTLFVEKRDGRRVVFDVDKIDKLSTRQLTRLWM
ncbi:anaerobic ribonucleoside triphosphate reductase [Streptococcus pneumoniae 1488]|nr:anaerobic ribonucleoside triphosphate reductase [Streptococcus pneumoniae 1488]